MKIVRGDLIKLALDGQFDVIVHGCNCFNTMGAGIALQIKQHFPEVYDIDQKTLKGDRNKLGTFTNYIYNLSKTKLGTATSYVYNLSNNEKVTHTLRVVNGYTQYAFWDTSENKKCLLDYEALRSVFKTIKNEFSGLRIGYPKIGCDLAGGDWSIVPS
jgi:O-acetyl-ADP-ribose deacetylase (regulator of RNase III)